jgi:SAM-dependent methyltransferase
MTASAWLRYDTVWPRVAALRPRRILEIGPGVAGFGARAAASCETYVGVERSADSREVAAGRLAAVPGADATVVAELDDVPTAERFDLVCAFEVLEHIEDDGSALAAWVGRAEPGGSVILSVPAHADRFAAGDEAVGHFRRYDPEALRALATDVGLTDVSVVLYGFPLGYLLEAVRNLLGRRALRSPSTGGGSKADRSAASGRWYQPSAQMGRAIEHATLPARWVQRRFPDRGTGLVLTGRRPS